ncbi:MULTISPECIES: tetratricopeptide repeat protein [unclassified Beijerinckia]|uniref:tetratricopeptide repeat protein n=1 Tax=unclassified Beijerinckia TaxID=2638183 RepID=UPI000899E6BF|nr:MULTISPECIES: tetratricopeptide repeat protein [unclassified Beijerinckia]MDH7796830.1 Flp pilus assembly protein TadD [Beijerinckia sp. GAS462]SEC61561.1 Flp pilus assembly protein TadD, contains TPR repeats [Beijerinckia sp. 28-YEA-48]
MNVPVQTAAMIRALKQAASAHVLTIATVLAAGTMLAGCQKISDVTGSITRSEPAAPNDPAAMRRYTEDLGRRYDAAPNDKAAVLRYSRALRATGQNEQATAVLQRAAATAPSDMDILGAYGKSLSDVGRLEEAASVLEKAHTPERPNWSIYSAQGSVADKMGDHQNAQSYYKAALQIAPDEPSVMSNLGLSYALTRQLPLAEDTLRRAAGNPRADSRVRQNLALILALQGKFTEAEEIERQVLPPQEAATNIAQIRQMIAQSNTWRDIQNYDRKPQTKPQAKTTARHRQPPPVNMDPKLSALDLPAR